MTLTDRARADAIKLIARWSELSAVAVEADIRKAWEIAVRRSHSRRDPDFHAVKEAGRILGVFE